MRLENKVAIITGAASGFGAGTARLFAAEGAAVVVADISDETGESIVDSINTSGGKAVYVHADVTSRQDTRNMIDAAEKLGGRLDILINNAGIIADDFASELSDEDWERVLKVNLNGTFIPCRALIPHLRERGSGVITNTSSISALGNRGQANYAASKAGMIGMSKSLAAEIASRGITVNCVAPGFIVTAMTEALGESSSKKLVGAIPVGRLGTPDDVAACALFLASDEAAYVTGQTLHVNGGMAMI